MDEIKLVNVKDMKTIEDYASCLVTNLMTLQTLGGFQQQALKIGILSEDECEACKSICWEIKRLIGLYKNQMDSVLDRTEIDEQQILDSLHAIANKKWGIPKKRKPKEIKED